MEKTFLAGEVGTCEKCHKVINGDYKWHRYGKKYNRICQSCFDEEILDDFLAWHDIFEEEYCEKIRQEESCDDCPFFFKKGCMMMLFHGLIGNIFHSKDIELKRLQKRNWEAVKEWEKQLKIAIENVNTKH
jgi:hypothetical protein